MAKQHAETSDDRSTIVLEGIDEGNDLPRIQVEVTDRDGATIHVGRVDRDGRFSLPDTVKKRAHRVVLGPVMPKNPTEEEESVARPVRHVFPADTFLALDARGPVAICRAIWERWIPRLRCVTGHLSGGRPAPSRYDARVDVYRQDQGEPMRVATGPIGPDGRVSIRWLEFGPASDFDENHRYAFVARPPIIVEIAS